MIRVGRIEYKKKRFVYPYYEDFKTIVITNDNKWTDLLPSNIVDENSYILENILQFSKVYERVPRITRSLPVYDYRTIWNHPAEVHIRNGTITPEYYNWREKGFNCKYPIKFPTRCRSSKDFVFALNCDGQKLDIIEYRKMIFFKEYSRLVRKTHCFKKLKKKINKGKNILIADLDGPKYNVLINKKNVRTLLNDTANNFCIGYCLAVTLLDKDKWIVG